MAVRFCYMSFFKPNYTPEQKAAMARGVARAKQFSPMMGGTTAKAAAKIAPKALKIVKNVPYQAMRTVAKNPGKYLGSMRIEGQKKAVKVFRHYTEGFGK
jgi:hypothetical protein